MNPLDPPADANAHRTVFLAGRELAPLGAGDPQEIEQFRLMQRIPGGNPFSLKFLARHDQLGYAFLKLLTEDASPEDRQAFTNEVRNAQKVSGRPGVPRYLGQGTYLGNPFLAQSFIVGPELGQALRERADRRLPTGDALALACQLMAAVQALSNADVVHCDIKPTNVILAREGASLVDFGASVLAEDNRLGRARFGTLEFASPEQKRGEVLTSASDVYSWAVLVAYASSGEHPFESTIEQETAPMTGPEGGARPDLLTVPTELRPIILKSLAYDPKDRPEVNDLLTDLRHILTVTSVTQRIHDPLPSPLSEPNDSIDAVETYIDEVVTKIGALFPALHAIVVAVALGLGFIAGCLVGVLLRNGA